MRLTTAFCVCLFKDRLRQSIAITALDQRDVVKKKSACQFLFLLLQILKPKIIDQGEEISQIN